MRPPRARSRRTRFPFDRQRYVRLSQMARGVTYRPAGRVVVIRGGTAYARPVELGPTDRFRCDGYLRSHYRFGRELRWGGLSHVTGLLNGRDAMLRVAHDEPEIWQPVDPGEPLP